MLRAHFGLPSVDSGELTSGLLGVIVDQEIDLQAIKKGYFTCKYWYIISTTPILLISIILYVIERSSPGPSVGVAYLIIFLFSITTESGEGRPPIKVKFEIPYFTTSGIQVGWYV